jgi:hypothetical protein
VLCSEFIGKTAFGGANSGEIDRKIYTNLKKQRQMPAFGWKS